MADVSQPDLDGAPSSPARLTRRSWVEALKRTFKEFQEDNLSDWAAALTYYGVLSIFPGLLVLASVLGLMGQSVKKSLLDNLTQIAPGSVKDVLTGTIDSAQQGRSFAGVVAIIGLLAAVWSASGYVGAFMRASNAVYDVPEGRPIWKKLPIRLGITVATGVMLVLSSLIVVFSGRLAEQMGKAIGLGPAAVTTWSILKWPVLVVLVSQMFALLYWASPNARPGGFRWISPGGILAVLLWLLASFGFAIYAANFSSYNKTYGTLAAVIIFLVWLWISNLAILLGLEFNFELERGRAIAAGHPPEEEPHPEPRDTRKPPPDTPQDHDRPRH